MVMGKLKISNINIEKNKDLLDMIYSYNDDLELEFSLSLCEIVQMFEYYVNRNIEMIGNINEYDCIYPEFKYIGEELMFTLNASDDEDDASDVEHIDRELKRHFGVSLLNCKAEHLFKILLIYCSDYYIEDNIINLDIYYENYKETWLGEYLKNID